MLSKQWRLACLGLSALLVLMSQATADDTVRLGGKGSIQDAGANLSRLDLRPQDIEEDTVPVGHRFGYGGGSFYRGGFYGGFRGGYFGGYRGGFYGGYRGFPGYYGGFRGYSSFYPRYSYGFGFNYYQPRYYGSFYGGGLGYGYGIGVGFNSFSGGYGGFSFSPSYYGGGFCQINGTLQNFQVQPLTLQLKPQVAPMNPNLNEPTLPNPQPNFQQNPNGGFRYDGGPANPIPLPQGSPETKQDNNQPMGGFDRAVSLPIKPSAPNKPRYAAYGEKPKADFVPVKDDDIIFVKGTKK